MTILRQPLALKLATTPETYTLSVFPGGLGDDFDLDSAALLVDDCFFGAGLDPTYVANYLNHPNGHCWSFQASPILLGDVLRRIEDAVPVGANVSIRAEKSAQR